MDENMKLTFPSLIGRSFEQNQSDPAMGFVGEKMITYGEMKKEVAAITALLEKAGITPGDRVAILSANMPNWGVVYLGVTFMGAVVVPILPDFSGKEVVTVLEHSGAKALFISSALLAKTGAELSFMPLIIKLDDFSIHFSADSSLSYVNEAVPVKSYDPDEEDLAAIIYTSGTTGKSKGVMLTHKNICWDTLAGRRIQPIEPADRFLSVLPMSHTYENTLGFMLPMISGASVYYLRKPPTAAVLLPALKEVRPTVMLTVPLIIEKIFFSKILPAFRKNIVVKSLYAIPFVRKKLHGIAGKKLYETFGGSLKFFGVGGAKLNRTVERFLIEGSFPYAVGYGLTETSPLLAGAPPANSVLQSTGPVVVGSEIRIENPDPKTGEGEIVARGPNIMKGYFNEPELTREVLSEDGWFRTGDTGRFDRNNNLYIKGRIKNMILGASGENIYPEEIESIINNFQHVAESLVIQQKGKLVAMVHLNMEELEEKYRHLRNDLSKQFDEKVDELLKELQVYVNEHVSKFSRINAVVLHPEPFQKTPTLKIKRYLYT